MQMLCFADGMKWSFHEHCELVMETKQKKSFPPIIRWVGVRVQYNFDYDYCKSYFELPLLRNGERNGDAQAAQIPTH